MDKENPKLRKNGGDGTNVGNALRWLAAQGKEFAPELLDIVGTATGIHGLTAIGDKIRDDKNIDDIDKQLLLQELNLDMQEMVELTKRLQSDNEHPITRLVRPISYGLMFILFLSCVFFDGNVGTFKIKEVYIPTIESLFGTMTVFYFGSRGIEKIMKTWGKVKNKQKL
tara:strand:- start:73219 stop:73725 length:507 start_codon:yes stop_codon:yes gene_type:complete